MVAHHPNIGRKFRNTDSIIKARKENIIPVLHSKYPGQEWVLQE